MFDAPSPPSKAVKQRHGKDVYYSEVDILVIVIDDDLTAQPMNASECAFAIACRRTVIGCIGAEIGRKFSFIEYDTHIFKYVTSRLLARQFTAFDQGGRFEAGTYRLDHITASDRWPRAVGTRRGSGNGNKRILRLGPSSVRQLSP